MASFHLPYERSCLPDWHLDTLTMESIPQSDAAFMCPKEAFELLPAKLERHFLNAWTPALQLEAAQTQTLQKKRALTVCP